MASVNGNDFLTDPTGSRRFLPFEVLNIDLEAAKRVDMDKVYAEAVWHWKSGFQYWFDESKLLSCITRIRLFIYRQLSMKCYSKVSKSRKMMRCRL